MNDVIHDGGDAEFACAAGSFRYFNAKNRSNRPVSREPRFYEAIRRYYPGLKDGALQPGYTGIRPRITGKGEEAVDFVIQGPRDHGVAGMVNLYGIESPGLTSSLAIAAHVRELLQ